jgi:phosphatidylethanolamine/phosphatidyl-N-methylethanolamine N-methyltransferase
MSLWLFLQSALRSPLQTGAIVPSSRTLARAMVDMAQIREGHVVAELGAGTGSFTREIVERHPSSPVFAFEACPRLGADLARRFTSARVVAAKVEQLPELASSLGLTRIDRIVSGLPWALWPEPRQAMVLDALIPFLSADVRFVTFHYLHSRWLGQVHATRRVLGERFSKVCYGPAVWRNLPPALVHVAAKLRSREGPGETVPLSQG